MSITVKQVNPVIDYRVRSLCLKPYPGHQNGCPNYGKKAECPPHVQKFEEIFDLTKPIYAIINTFDYKTHTDQMRELHPMWSEKQINSFFYWQRKAKSQLSIGIAQFLAEHVSYHIITCPEALGVDVIKTLADNGINLEWPPKTVTYQVAIAGIQKKNYNGNNNA